MSFGLLGRLISKARNPRIRGQRKVMRTLPQPTIRELDHRTNDGIDVRLKFPLVPAVVMLSGSELERLKRFGAGKAFIA